jgi:HPt (histidine-containing phosphotransfer) domain-containing protein
MLNQMVGNNPEMHRRILKKFLVKAREQVAAIRSAVAAKDTAALCSLAHTFKSDARTVGAMRLGELCQEMEMAGEAEDFVICNALNEPLSAAFDVAAEKIEQNLN